MTKEYIGSTCPNCGDETLRYSPRQNKLTCGNCRFEQITPQKAFFVPPRPLAKGKGVFLTRLNMGLERANSQDLKCKSCNAIVNVDEDENLEIFKCSFCASSEYEKIDASNKVVTPWGLAPFNIPQRRALEILEDWIREDWIGRYFFYPRDFLNFAKLEHIKGVYVPYWSYKASAKATWYIFAGYKAQENQRRWKTEDLRWVPKSIYFENTFDEIYIPASNGLGGKELSELFDFSDKEIYQDITRRIVPYKTEYLKEFDAELYQADMKSGLAVVDILLDLEIQGACLQRAVEEGVQDFVPIDFPPDKPALSSAKEGLTFKHIFLPVWIATYKYKGKTMPFVIGGLHGKITGERPFDNRRFGILAGIFGFLLILLVLFVDGCM